MLAVCPFLWGSLGLHRHWVQRRHLWLPGCQGCLWGIEAQGKGQWEKGRSKNIFLKNDFSQEPKLYEPSFGAEASAILDYFQNVMSDNNRVFLFWYFPIKWQNLWNCLLFSCHQVWLGAKRTSCSATSTSTTWEYQKGSGTFTDNDVSKKITTEKNLSGKLPNVTLLLLYNKKNRLPTEPLANALASILTADAGSGARDSRMPQTLMRTLTPMHSVVSWWLGNMAVRTLLKGAAIDQLTLTA